MGPVLSATKPRPRAKAARRAAPARPASRPRRRSAGASATPHGLAAGSAGCAIVTVSDTRGPRDDRSGDLAERLLADAGHRVLARAWTRDEPAGIRRAVRAALRRSEVDLVVLTGGTGVALRDRTPEAVEGLLDQRLDGFGELFRALSYERIGTAAWVTRAGAGVARGRIVVYLPGSPDAVELGLSGVLIPELRHLLKLLGRLTRSD